MNTVITEKMSDGTEVSYDVFSKLVESRILFIHSFLDDVQAVDIVATLLYMDSQNDSDPISLYLNLEGADVRSAFAIYDVMQLLSSKIKTYCLGSVIGEAALILAAGDERYATGNSTICLSQLGYGGSNVADLKNTTMRFEQAKKDNDNFVNALAFECKKNVKSLMKEIEHEKYFTAAEAKKFGIIDHIIGEKKADVRNVKK